MTSSELQREQTGVQREDEPVPSLTSRILSEGRSKGLVSAVRGILGIPYVGYRTYTTESPFKVTNFLEGSCSTLAQRDRAQSVEQTLGLAYFVIVSAALTPQRRSQLTPPRAGAVFYVVALALSGT
jgi:hypothetical protein